jgi:hypothetical protein
MEPLIKEEPQNNDNILFTLGIVGALGVGAYLIFNYLTKSTEEDEDEIEERIIPKQIAQPFGGNFVYEDRFPDFYPYKSFANPARRPYFGGLPIPVPIESIYVPPPVLGYWNPNYPNTDNR